MKPVHALLCSLMLTPAMLLWLKPSHPDAGDVGTRQSNHATRAAMSAPSVPISATIEQPPENISTDDRSDRTAIQSPPSLDRKAIDLLRSSIAQGDPRTPALAEDQRLYQRTDENIRANPQAYSAHQSAQQMQRRATYVYAAGKKLAEIDEQLAWGRDNGVSDAQLAMAQEKRDRLARARERLLEQNPDIPDIAISPEPLQQK